ncbi:hypothetical protein FHG87_013019 [Trinorchestia longiramus]|nr:hypothetical protein FHG87_013019 [Trinorchestia longiramus]
MTLTKRTPDTKAKPQLKEKKKKLKNKSRCGIYEALRRERFNEQLKKLQDVLAPEVVVKTKVEIVIAAQLFVRRCKSLHSPKGLPDLDNQKFDDHRDDGGLKSIKETGKNATESNTVHGTTFNLNLANAYVQPNDVHSVENTYPLVELDQNCKINLNEVVGMTVLNNATNVLPVQPNINNCISKIHNNKPVSCLHVVNNSNSGNEANQLSSEVAQCSMPSLTPDTGQTCTLLSAAKSSDETPANLVHKDLLASVHSEAVKIVLKEPAISTLSVNENQGILVESLKIKSPQKVIRTLAPCIQSKTVISPSNAKPLLTPRLVGAVHKSNVLPLVASTRASIPRDCQLKRSPRRLMKKPLNHSVNSKNLQLILSPSNNGTLSTSPIATSSAVAKIVHKCPSQVKLLAPRNSPDSQAILAFEPVQLVQNVRPEAPIVVLCPSLKPPPPKLRNIAPKQSPSTSQFSDHCETKNSNLMMPLITREELLAEKKRTSCLAPSFRPEKRLKLSPAARINDSTKNNDSELASSKKSLLSPPKSTITVTPSDLSPSIVSYPSNEIIGLDSCHPRISEMSAGSLETNSPIVACTPPVSQCSLKDKDNHCPSLTELSTINSVTSESSVVRSKTLHTVLESNSSKCDMNLSREASVSCSVASCSSTVSSNPCIDGKVTCASTVSWSISSSISSTNVTLPKTLLVPSNSKHLCTNNYTNSANTNDNTLISLKADHDNKVVINDSKVQSQCETANSSAAIPKVSSLSISPENQVSSGLEIYSQISIPTATRDILYSDRKCLNSCMSASSLPETHPILLPTSCHMTPVASIISSDPGNSSHSSSHCPSKRGSPSCANISSTAVNSHAATRSVNISCGAGIDFDNKVGMFDSTARSESAHPCHQPIANKLLSSTIVSAGVSQGSVSSTAVIPMTDSLSTLGYPSSSHSVSVSDVVDSTTQSKGNLHSVQNICSSASTSSNYSITALCMSSKGKAMTNSNVRDTNKSSLPLCSSKFLSTSVAHNSFTTELASSSNHGQTTSTPFSKGHEPFASIQAPTTSEDTSRKLDVLPHSNKYNSVSTSAQSKTVASIDQKNTATIICTTEKSAYLPQLKLTNSVSALDHSIEKSSGSNSCAPPTTSSSEFSSPNSIKSKHFIMNEQEILTTGKTNYSDAPSVTATASCSFSSGLDVVTSVMRTSASVLIASKSDETTSYASSGSTTVTSGSNSVTSCVGSSSSVSKENELNAVVSNDSNSNSSSIVNRSIITSYANKSSSEAKAEESVKFSYANNLRSTVVTSESTVVTLSAGNSVSISISRAPLKSTSSVVSALPEQISCASISSASSSEKPSASIFPSILSSGPAPSFSPLQCLPLSISDSVSSSCFSATTPAADLNLVSDASASVSQGQAKFGTMYPSSIVTTSGIQNRKMHTLHSSNSMYSNLMLNTPSNFTFLCPTSTGLGSSLRPTLCASSSLISSNSSIYSFSSSQNYSPNYATFASLPLSHSTPTSFSFSLSSNPSSVVSSDVANTYSLSGHTHTGFGSSNNSENVNFPTFMASSDAHQNYPVQPYHRYPIASSWDNCSSTESLSTSSLVPSSFVVSLTDPCISVQNFSKPLDSSSSTLIQSSTTNSSKNVANTESSSSTTDHFSDSLKAIIKKPSGSTYSMNSSHKTTDTLSSIVTPPRALPTTTVVSQHSFVSTSLSSAGFFVPSSLHPVNINKTKISSGVKEQVRDSSICSSQEQNFCTNGNTPKNVLKETVLPSGMSSNPEELKSVFSSCTSTLQGIYPEKEKSTESLVSCSEPVKNRDSPKISPHTLLPHNCSVSSSVEKSNEESNFSHSKPISENKGKGIYTAPVESFNSSTSLAVGVSTAISLSGVSYPTTDRAVNAVSTFLPPPLPFFTSGVDLSLENSNVSYYHPVSCSTTSETPSASVQVSKNNSMSTQPTALSTLSSDSLCFYPLSTPMGTHQKMQTSDIISLGSTPSVTSSTYGSIACMTSSRGTPWTPHSNSATVIAHDSTKTCVESDTSITISRSDPCLPSHSVAPMLVGSKGHDFSQSYLDYTTSCSSSGLQHSLYFTKPSCAADSSRVTTVQATNIFSSSQNKNGNKLVGKNIEVKTNVSSASCVSSSKELKKDSQPSEMIDAKANKKQISQSLVMTHRPESNISVLRDTNVSNHVLGSTLENSSISGSTTNSIECINVSSTDESMKHKSLQDVNVMQGMSTPVSTSEPSFSKQAPELQLLPENQSSKTKAQFDASRSSDPENVQKNENPDLAIESSKISQINTVCGKTAPITQSQKLSSVNKRLNELTSKPEHSFPITAGQSSRGELSTQMLTVSNPSTGTDTSTTVSTGQRSIIDGNKSQDLILLNSTQKSTIDRTIEETSSNLHKQSVADKTVKTQTQSVTHDQSQARPQQPVQLSQQMQTAVHASQNTNFQQNFLQQQQKSLLHQQSHLQKQPHDLEAQQLQQQQQHHMNLQLPGPTMQHHHPHHLHNTQQQAHQTHQHHQQHQHQHLMGSNLYSPSTFDYSGSIYNRRHSTSPRGDARHCYATSSYNKEQHLQHYQLDDHNPLNDLSGVNNYILEDGTDERETLADPVRYFSVSHLVSQSTSTRKQPANSATKSDDKKTEKGTKQVGTKKNESKSRGKTVATSDSRRRSPARSQVSVQQAAMWHSSKQGVGQSKTPNYSAEALLSSQNYMRTAAAVAPQPINQNYPIMTQNVYQYPHQMKNFSQNTAVPFGYSSATNNTVDACTPDYNFQLHQTAGPLGYAGNMPYMTPTYPYQTSSSSGMLPSDIMAASHPPPPPPPPYPRFHEFPPDQNSFPPNPSFPFAFDTQDMCGGSNGAVGSPQYSGTMLDNSTIIGGSSTTSSSHRSGPCVPFSPLRMMDRQQGAVVANMTPAAQLSSSLSNFNLTSIIPEIDNKVGGDNSSILSTSRGGVVPAAASSRPSAAPPADPTYALKLPQLDHAAANKAQFHANSMNNFFPAHPQVGFGLNTASLPLPTSSFSCLNFPPPEHS